MNLSMIRISLIAWPMCLGFPSSAVAQPTIPNPSFEQPGCGTVSGFLTILHPLILNPPAQNVSPCTMPYLTIKDWTVAPNTYGHGMVWIKNRPNDQRSMNYIAGAGALSWMETRISGLAPNKKYDLSFWTINSTGSDAPRSALTVSVGLGPNITQPPSAFAAYATGVFSNVGPVVYYQTWQQHHLCFKAPSNQDFVILHFSGPPPGIPGGSMNQAYVDDFAIKEVRACSPVTSTGIKPDNFATAVKDSGSAVTGTGPVTAKGLAHLGMATAVNDADARRVSHVSVTKILVGPPMSPALPANLTNTFTLKASCTPSASPTQSAISPGQTVDITVQTGATCTLSESVVQSPPPAAFVAFCRPNAGVAWDTPIFSPVLSGAISGDVSVKLTNSWHCVAT